MLNFKNLEIAFKDKSKKDLDRAFILFKTLDNKILYHILLSFLRIALFLRLPITYIIKSTVYKHFCGGITINDSEKTIQKLWKSKIGTILDFSAEGKEKEADFKKVMHETLECIKEAKRKKSIPFAVFKPTGLVEFHILEKINKNSLLNTEDTIKKELFLSKIFCICESAAKNKVPVFIDAEESWIQDGIDNIALDMMRKFNKKDVWIFNTIQFYRKDRIGYLKKIIKKAEKDNFLLGLKLVRGAYYEKENQRATERNYPSPVHQSKEKTDRDYNNALEMCIKNINIMSICAGTHNEESSFILSQLMKKYNLAKNDKRIYFSQLLGMSDHISYNTAKKGYNVAKYVPYGPIKDVLPYLIRRAEENSSISGQMNRELNNISRERRRRRKKRYEKTTT